MASNTFYIRELSGTTTDNYPVQIGRAFVQGEITDYPQVSISGTLITTQADIKNRWSDGTVKFAVISFYIPTLSAGRTVHCSVVNQSTGNNTGFMTSADMLNAAYNFNATISITSAATTLVTSARSMITTGHYSYWLQGSICTTVILTDHTSACIYDMALNSYSSFRPIFHVTFWPLINKTKIRYIGEISNTSKLQDYTYNLSLTKGNTNVSAVYSKNPVNHYIATRWTKEYWIGVPPNKIDLNHNLSYLAETKLIFNYDSTKTISESRLSSEYTSWVNASKDLYDNALLTMDQGTAGGRPEIAPVPGWLTRWLYCGDWRMKDMALGLADLAAAWPIHFREGNSTKNIQGSTPGIGKIMSVRNRPTIWIDNFTYSETLTADRVTLVGPQSANVWNPDLAHMPDMNTVPYLLTGDFFYLEELYFWASWSVAADNGAAYNFSWGRGPTGAEGAINYGQVRAQAWNFRTRCHAAVFAPDSTIEKTYFTTLIDDAIAAWEGTLSISGTSYQGNSLWNWGRTRLNFSKGIPPLKHWYEGGTIFNQAGYGINDVVSEWAASNFEQHFMMVVLGRGYELGFATSAVLSFLSEHYYNVLTNSDYNRYLLQNGRVPTVRRSDSQYFDTWAQLKTGYTSAWQVTSAWENTDPTHGYDFIGLAASSYILNDTNNDAWRITSAGILSSSLLNDNPTWALVRRFSSSSNPSQLVRIDITGHGIRLKL